MSSNDQPKCPVDPSTRDVWLKKSQALQKSQNSNLTEHLAASQSLNESATTNNSSSWSLLSRLLWAPDKGNTSSITSETPGCPVPHALNAQIPIDHPVVPGITVSNNKTCPVDSEAREVWTSNSKLQITKNEPESIECSSDNLDQSLTTPANAVKGGKELSEDREISSIPRSDADSNWVYPSQRQFFNAMLRKQWSPVETDMKTVVPLHNMVNETAWHYIQSWELDQGGEKCGGIKLTSFKGDAKKLTPRALIGHYIFGRDLPFDRHDWVINRCGKRVDYVIDFYTTVVKEGEEPKFFLDVRPKLNTLEGCRLRIFKALGL